MATVGRARVDRQARMVIPAEIRKAAGIRPGDTVSLVADDESIRLRINEQAIRTLQRELPERVPPCMSTVDELIAERGAQVANEEAELQEGLARSDKEAP